MDYSNDLVVAIEEFVSINKIAASALYDFVDDGKDD